MCSREWIKRKGGTLRGMTSSSAKKEAAIIITSLPDHAKLINASATKERREARYNNTWFATGSREERVWVATAALVPWIPWTMEEAQRMIDMLYFLRMLRCKSYSWLCGKWWEHNRYINTTVEGRYK
jgi:hypothetical protein